MKVTSSRLAICISLISAMCAHADGAQDCAPIDLRSDALGEARDQGTIGWCYAYAAADLLTAKLGKKISAVDVAESYNDTQLKQRLKHGVRRMEGRLTAENFLIESGLVDKALKRSLHKGLCIEEQFHSKEAAINYTYRNMIALIDSFNSKERSFILGSESISCQDQLSYVQTIFPNVTAEDLRESILNPKRHSVFQRLAEKACKERIFPEKKITVNNHYYQAGENVQKFSAIDHQLNQGNLVAVSYDFNILLNKDAHSDITKGHTSTIVGRRPNPTDGKCEYLIRNSLGPLCKATYDSRLKCENGNIWIPKEDLGRQSWGVTYLEMENTN